jgi:FKBP-type peptidyl-prolyl cis-trans isomerase 2
MTMTKAKTGDRVQLHYTKKSEDGEVMDTSKQGPPLEIRIGSRLVPLFEEAVLGLQKGDKREIVIPMEKAYGRYEDSLVFELDKSQFAGDTLPEVGGKAKLRRQDGNIVEGTVTAIDESKVILDANHPLAGKPIKLEIEVIAIA